MANILKFPKSKVKMSNHNYTCLVTNPDDNYVVVTYHDRKSSYTFCIGNWEKTIENEEVQYFLKKSSKVFAQ